MELRCSNKGNTHGCEPEEVLAGSKATKGCKPLPFTDFGVPKNSYSGKGGLSWASKAAATAHPMNSIPCVHRFMQGSLHPRTSGDVHNVQPQSGICSRQSCVGDVAAAAIVAHSRR